MRLLRLAGWGAYLPLALVLSSCSGGGGNAPATLAGNATNPGLPVASKTARVVPARFTFTIPRSSAHGASRSRKPQYLPATALSLELQLVTVGGSAPSPTPLPTIANVGSSVSGCTATSGDYTCTVTVGLPIGLDVVLVKSFDAASAGGNVLSQQNGTFTVVSGTANSFTMTLDANLGAIVLTAPSSVTTYCGTSISITSCRAYSLTARSFDVQVTDAHGTALANNLIAGSPVLSATSSNTASATVSVTQNPYAIIVTSIANGIADITVTASPATNTSGLSPTTRTFALTTGEIDEPGGLAVTANGIYVTNHGFSGSTVTKYAIGGGMPILTIPITPREGGPQGVALDASGNLYVVNSYVGVQKYDASGSQTETLAPDTSYFTSPNAVALDTSGNVYVSDPGNPGFSVAPTVKKYSANGVGPSLTITNGLSGLNEPTAVAVDGSGDIYVASSNNTVEKYDASGTPLSLSFTGMNYPVGVAVDGSGNIYVVNFFGKNVTKYASGGGSPILTISIGLTGPTAIALDASGNIYVTDQNSNTVTEYAPTGGSPILTIY